MHANAETPPAPLADRAYSGSVLVRVASETHRALVLRAAEEGVSLNRLVSARLADCRLAIPYCEDTDMPLHNIDALGVRARQRRMREAADLSPTAAVAELENVLGVTRTPDHADGAGPPECRRLAMLAAETHPRELLSEGQLARLLRLDRIELRKMLDAADIDRTADINCSPREAKGAAGARP